MQIHPLLGKRSSMTARRWFPLTIIFVGVLSLPTALAGDKPDLMLAEIYQQGIDISQYWVSEKLDGVRARWDGKHLLSRGGHIFAPPPWFTKNFPEIPLDGELSIGRSRYEETASIVRRQHPHEGWRAVRFMVFDLPAHRGTFDERVSAMKYLAKNVDSPYFGIIKARNVRHRRNLEAAIAVCACSRWRRLDAASKTRLLRERPKSEFTQAQTLYRCGGDRHRLSSRQRKIFWQGWRTQSADR